MESMDRDCMVDCAGMTNGMMVMIYAVISCVLCLLCGGCGLIALVMR